MPVERYQTWTNVDLVVRIPVTFDQGAPFSSLAGAEVDARARFPNGQVIVGEAEVDDDDTTIIVTFRRYTLPVGLGECQVWARVGTQAAMPFVFEADVRQGFRPET